MEDVGVTRSIGLPGLGTTPPVPEKVDVKGGDATNTQDTLGEVTDGHRREVTETSLPVTSSTLHVVSLRVQLGEIDIGFLVPVLPPGFLREVSVLITKENLHHCRCKLLFCIRTSVCLPEVKPQMVCDRYSNIRPMNRRDSEPKE